MIDALSEGWALRPNAGKSIAMHYFRGGLSVCQRYWPQGEQILEDDPRGMRCPDCKLILSGKRPRLKASPDADCASCGHRQTDHIGKFEICDHEECACQGFSAPVEGE